MNGLSGVARATRHAPRIEAVGLRKLAPAALAPCVLLALCFAAYGAALRAGSDLVYVLDSGSMKDKSQVLVVDPVRKQVVRRFGAGYQPDMALSPDGGRLYVASTVNNAGRLDIYDTASGDLVRTVDNKDRWIPTTSLYNSHMAVSPDGKWLYIYKYEVPTDLYYIATFDTAQERFLPEMAPLPECINSVMSPSAEGRQLMVLCTSANDLRFIKIMDDGKGQITSLPLRLRGRSSRFGLAIGLSTVLSTPSGEKAVVGDGSFFDVNGKTKRIKRLGVIDGGVRKISYSESPSLTADRDDWMGGRWLPLQAPTLSPRSGKVYLGISPVADVRRSDWTYNAIGVFDSDNLNRVGLIEAKTRLHSISVNAAGDRLYGVAPASKSLVVFDADSGNEIGVMENVGENPILVIAAP